MITTSDRYHVQVLVRESATVYNWRFVHPTRGDPYVFGRAEAEDYIRTHTQSSAEPGRYRLYQLSLASGGS